MRSALKRVLLHGIARLADHVQAQRGAILCLHSVRDESAAGGFSPLRHLAVSPGFLETLVRDLRARNFALVSLSEAIRRTRYGESGGRFVALTFDDGYADNCTEALPVLARLGVPFTVFLTSGFLDGTVPMWWVGFETILRSQDRVILPDRIVPAGTRAEKLAAFAALDKIVRQLPPDGLPGFCRQVFALNPQAGPHEVAAAAVLNWNQARAMAGTGLVTFGCHTVSHPILARLDRTPCATEIRNCRDRIANELGVVPEFFAYPYGGTNEVGAIAPRVVAKCGFKAAFTTSGRLRPLRNEADVYAVPRLVIGEDLVVARTLISGLPDALRDMQGALLRRLAWTRAAQQP